MNGNTGLIGQSVSKTSASKIENAILCSFGESSGDVSSPVVFLLAISITRKSQQIKLQFKSKTLGKLVVSNGVLGTFAVV